MFRKLLLLLVFGLSCQAILPVKIQTGSHGENFSFIADDGEFELTSAELSQLQSALIDGILEDHQLEGDTIPVPINKNTFALLKTVLNDTPEFDAERAENILRESTVAEFLPLLSALSFLNVKNEMLLQITAQHYLTLQQDLSEKEFSTNLAGIASFFQANCAHHILKVTIHALLPSKLTEHDGAVHSVAFSPDGKTLASAGSHTNIRVWQIADDKWKCTESLTQDTRHISSVSFSPNGKTLLSRSVDGNITDWQITDNHWHEVKTVYGYFDHADSVVFSSNGKIFASLCGDNIGLWRRVDGHWQHSEMISTSNRVNSLAFSPDDKTLASGSIDGIIRLWQIVDGHWQCIETLIGHRCWVNSVVFSPDGKTIASGSMDGPIIIWPLELTELDEIQQLFVLWTMQKTTNFKPNGNKVLDSIFTSLPISIQQRLLIAISETEEPHK